MKIRLRPFVEFAYGDKRRDRAAVNQTLIDMKKDYDPATDRYKQFRENLFLYESGEISASEFKNIYISMTPNKQAGYHVLAENYLDLKEDHGLIWQGLQRSPAELGRLKIQTSWYLRTEASNMRRVIFLNLRKEPFPIRQEKGILTLLQIAEPQSAGVGILNIQSSTLIVRNRLDVLEKKFLQERAARFVEIADSI